MRKAFICPTKYVQGEDELLNLGYFVDYNKELEAAIWEKHLKGYEKNFD